MVIPYENLSEQALEGLIEEYVTRDEDLSLSLESKKEQILRQLKNKQIVIVFDTQEETTSIINVDQLV